MGKKRFTDEQYQFARYQSNALEYAKRRGYNLIRDSAGKYRLREHDSMIFTEDGRWFWNSRSLSGGAIEFAMNYENLSLPEAVLAICSDGTAGAAFSASPAEPREKKKEFTLPPKAGSCLRLYSYLCKSRGIDREILHDAIKRGDIYESIRNYRAADGTKGEAHNAVFIGRDENGIPHSAYQRGLTTFSGKNAFKRDVSGSDPKYPFVVPSSSPNSTMVVVFEAAIDALSHASVWKMAGLPYDGCHRIALGGTQKSIGLMTFLKRHPNVKSIMLAFDEDEGGNNAAVKLKTDLTDKGYKVIISHQSLGKDWNDCLKVWQTTLKEKRWSGKSGAAGCIIYLDDNNRPARTYPCETITDMVKTSTLLFTKGERFVVYKIDTDKNKRTVSNPK